MTVKTVAVMDMSVPGVENSRHLYIYIDHSGRSIIRSDFLRARRYRTDALNLQVLRRLNLLQVAFNRLLQFRSIDRITIEVWCLSTTASRPFY